MAAPTITRTHNTDDDLTGTVGTVLNDAWKQEFYDQIDAVVAAEDAVVRTVPHGGTGVATLAAHGVVVGAGASAVAVTGAGTAGQVLTSNGAAADPTFQTPTGTSSVATTGNISALALPPGFGPLTIYMTNATLATIQGIAAGTAGQRLRIISTGAGQVDLSHQDAAAAAALRLINMATSGKTSLAPGSGVAELEYDLANTRWRLVTHEQGAWITPAYAAGNFTASAGTWTVDAGDITTMAYWLKGRSLAVTFNFVTTSVSSTPVFLQIGNGAYGSFTSAKTMLNLALYNDNGAGNTQGFAQAAAAATLITIGKNAGSFAIATNTTAINGTLMFEVQ